MKIFKWMAVFGFCVFPLLAKAEATCLGAAQVRTVQKKYIFGEWNEAQKKWSLIKKLPLCDDGSRLFKAVHALIFLNELPKLDRARGGLPSLVADEGPAAFLHSRADMILFEPPTQPICQTSSTVAYVNIGESRVMHLCPHFLQTYLTPMSSASVLLHEARHTEGQGYLHAQCQFGPNRSLGYACDTSFEQQGSYGVAAGFLLSVYQGARNPLLRQQARAEAVVELVSRFNELPLGVTPQAVVHSQDGSVGRFDGVRVSALTSGRGDAVALFDGVPQIFQKNGAVFEDQYASSLADSGRGFASLFKDLSSADRGEFLDVTYADSSSCLLFKTNLFCLVGSSFAKLQFDKLHPVSLFEAKEQTFLVDRSGKHYVLPEKVGVYGLREKDLKRVKTYEGFLSATSWSTENTYAVSVTGELYFLNNARKKWVLVPGTRGQKFRKVLGPYYWSQKLQDL